MSENPKAVYLKNYQAPEFTVLSIDLQFELISPDKAIVDAKLKIRRNGEHNKPLVLTGEELKLCSVAVNNKTLLVGDYQVSEESLTIPSDLKEFECLIQNEINPENNQALSGLYISNGIFCTQCEAEGFRRITYFIDRPDNMSKYTCKIIADKTKYPILLSNGNCVDQGDLEDGRHYVVWDDPFKKPSYLFALVAGDLVSISDTFTTMSGRKIACNIYVEHGNETRCDYAMSSLKKAMRWDEETYGREYDLDIFNIVAVEAFNMGAMENKSLNIFNAKYILADTDTATDEDFKGIELVVAHEYFHNWTGNRITCRDWFQLSLKEGLTVFREQQFTGDMNNHAETRIKDVRTLRASQFPEDSGPMAHPVQPDSYIEINNFYTMTIYHKGAEINHMLYALLGRERFRKGSDLYFERHDGQAVTINEWVGALADANDLDLSQFMRWYKQAGTPVLTITDDYDATKQHYRLTIHQHCPDTPGQTQKKPFHIPLVMGLLDQQGNPIELGDREKYSKLIEITEETTTVEFNDIIEKPILSLLRGFSAPVKIKYAYDSDDLLKLFAHDVDGFAQWDAGQILYQRELLPAIQNYQGTTSNFQHLDGLVSALNSIIDNTQLDNSLKVLLFCLPTFNELAEASHTIDATAIVDVKHALQNQITEALQDKMLEQYHQLHERDFQMDYQSRANRSLKNLYLNYLTRLGHAAAQQLCIEQYQQANNMTDKFAAIEAISHSTIPQREALLDDFYQQWSDNPLVIDKWLSVQARAGIDSVFMQVKALTQHQAFNIKNPNKVRAVLGAFANGNPKYFHAADGEPYKFYTEKVIEIDQFNPQIAARLLSPYTQWKKYKTPNCDKMRDELIRINNLPNISRDVFEIVSKSLEIEK